MYSLSRCCLVLAALVTGPAAADPATICVALPKAQLGQGNNAPTDVSEPVRTALGTYMAGPNITLVRVDARIPVQIDAEAVQKGCSHILQSSVEQKKHESASGFLRKLAPLANALPMMGGMSGSAGGMIAAQTAGQVAASAAAEAAQEDYAQAMTGAQQGSVKSGDTMNVSYVLTRPGDAKPLKQNKFTKKAEVDGEDLLAPLLEQVATEVVAETTSAPR
jgi:hypothetical protein